MTLGDVFDLATKFHSFVNFYLDPPMTKAEEKKYLEKQERLIKKIEKNNPKITPASEDEVIGRKKVVSNWQKAN